MFSSPRPGVHFQVKRVELRGPTPLFCCWLVKDLLHSHLAPAPRTHLLLASLPSSSHSVCELPGSGLGQVGLRPSPAFPRGEGAQPARLSPGMGEGLFVAF